ncbi:MAG: hypothetical protein H0S78_08260 [Tissierellales bacterium]|jgi:hypothetical protein|nr:hypothetical protein [Tissierellales bacterium]
MNIMSNIKKSYEKFLQNLTDANKKSFGNKPLECCDLNQESKTSTKIKKRS